MRTALRILGVLAIGTLLGLAATWETVIHGGWGGDVSDGRWRTSLTAGSNAGGMYQRASVAVHGLLALNRSETMYYSANIDSSGSPLSGRCTYMIVGRDPPARWWSVTAYGADDYLIANPAGRYSVTMNSVTRARDGTFAVHVANGGSGPNWIPPGGGPFSLTIRLYNPDARVMADPEHVPLPVVTRERCT